MPQRATVGFLLRHPAHWIALGFGSGLAPRAPGTVGTLWGWLAFLLLNPWLGPGAWALVIAAALLLGVWACTLTARHLDTADPGAVVWDEVVAIWIVMWLLTPAAWWAQLAAFAIFRWFDALKPGPVGWADRLFKRRPGEPIGWHHGAGILFDDLVAAGCTLLFIAVWLTVWRS
jgi:phosphatidylglycerophosphatase A